jgi:DNA invertase Pin-like site-specific DNA recombinase
MTVYAYYRVSTDEQDYENQKQGVVAFSERMNLPIEVEVLDEGKSGALAPEKKQLGQLLGVLKEGDVIIASEISRISRKLTDLFKIAGYLNDKKVKLYTVKDNYTLDNSIQGQVLLFAFGLSAQIERDMISQRTKEALARKKKEGVRLGRPFGPKYYKLTKYDEYIRQCVEAREGLKYIARKLDCDWKTLQTYCKDHGIKTYGKDVIYRTRKSKNEIKLYDVDYSKTYVKFVNKQLVVV